MGLEKTGVVKHRKIYGNCQVLSPDGILMFRCGLKKANWYLSHFDKNGYPLGEKCSDDPLIVKLTFIPKGLGNHNKKFGLSDMINQCVSCGSEEYLTRHHVVPYCYRRYLPMHIKSHNFHDVLSLCINCHESYERHADILKKSISIQYNAPLHGKIKENKNLTKYRKIANTLLKKDILKIPNNKILKMRKILKSDLSIKRLTNKNIEYLSNIKIQIIGKTHGEMVVESLQNIQEFIEMWRNHFVNNVDCRYLPENWSTSTK